MSETIAPCPVCGELGIAISLYHTGCSVCDFVATPDRWNRLSRAAALLRAVETMAPGYVKIKPSEMPSEWVASVQYGRLHDYARADSPAAAIIALAQQIGACNDK